MALEFPDHYGLNFTKTLHHKAEGRTDPLNNKLPPGFVAVITGAGKGLGYYTSLQFAKAQISGISISSRTQSDLDRLSTELRKINPDLKILATICDTSKESDVQKLANDVKSTFQRVDAVIANAGVNGQYVTAPDGSLHQAVGLVEDVDFDHVMTVNVLGTHKTAKYFVPLLAESKDGAKLFVAVSSASAFLPASQLVPLSYNLSKFAMNRLVETIHNDYHEKAGILVYAVHPGVALTQMSENNVKTDLGEIWNQCKARPSYGTSFDLIF
jgi:NAD(P)-dependent dehydrogenase (short-subunit alcohol dehydrogenase family)